MRQSRYLNGVLTIIAICLIIITLSITGNFPGVMAGTKNTKGKNYVTLPLNPDGSLNVKVSNVMDVNIKQVEGREVYSGVVPVRAQ